MNSRNRKEPDTLYIFAPSSCLINNLCQCEFRMVLTLHFPLMALTNGLIIISSPLSINGYILVFFLFFCHASSQHLSPRRRCGPWLLRSVTGYVEIVARPRWPEGRWHREKSILWFVRAASVTSRRLFRCCARRRRHQSSPARSVCPRYE